MTLVVVSNRLPFVILRNESGALRVEPGSGGLVTALQPILRNRGGRWIGWTGATSEELPDSISRVAGSARRALSRLRGLLGRGSPTQSGPPDPAALFADAARRFGYEIIPISLSTSERDLFYYGFSNRVLWPLFHDLPSHCEFKPEYWAAYQAVNRKFAETTAKSAAKEDFIWVHDYQLLMVGRELRDLGVEARLGFFLHIPFPALDLFLKLPWRFPVLEAMLAHDLVGFQTRRDLRNFLACVSQLMPEARIEGEGSIVTLRVGAREVRAGAFPISIDPTDFERQAGEEDVVEKKLKIREDAGGRKIILGIDRLDYTKGLPNKLEAFRWFLTRHPEFQGVVTLIQIIVPSREDIPEYQENKMQVERLIGEINGQFTREGWAPIHYIYRSLEGPRLPAYYLAAEVALVTPLKDGMNLVSKEYCATRIDGDGALVLSEFAGAAGQLQVGAYLVNPYDVEGVSEALASALNAGEDERRARMARLRTAIKQADIFQWLDSILEAAISKSLADFPVADEYLPGSEGESERRH
jgi:trehalose 6-phosphate synthase